MTGWSQRKSAGAIVRCHRVARQRTGLPSGHRREEASVEREEPLLNVRNNGSGAALLEFRAESALVLGPPGLGQGPPGGIGDAGPAHLPKSLEIQQTLLHLGTVETETRSHPVSISEAEKTHSMQNQYRGFRRRYGHNEHHAAPRHPEIGTAAGPAPIRDCCTPPDVDPGRTYMPRSSTPMQ